MSTCPDCHEDDFHEVYLGPGIPGLYPAGNLLECSYHGPLQTQGNI